MAGKTFTDSGRRRSSARSGKGEPFRERESFRWLLSPRATRGSVQEGESVPVVRQRDQLYRWVLAAADVLAATLAVFLGISFFGDEMLSPAALGVLPLIVLASKAIGLYDRDQHLMTKRTLDEAPSLLQVATLFVLIVWLGEDWLVHSDASSYLAKRQVLGLWALLLLFLIVFRFGARRLVRSFAPWERCLVLGDPRSAARMQQKLAESPHLKGTIVGRLALSDERRKAGGPGLLGSVESLEAVLGQEEIHRVIIAPRTSDSQEILHTIRLAKSMGVRVSVLPRLFEVVGSSVEFDEIEGVPLLGVRRGGLTRSSRAMKRGTDLVAAVGGVIVLAPVLIAVAVAVKLTSRGPVFFRQDRIGRGGEVFSMLKFRSMVEDADERKCDLTQMNEAAEGFFKIADDPRITPVGRFVRRTCLDELPQLFNVIRGHMSLVGPRPLVPDEDERIEGHHRSRLELTPGMTGVWQILGSSRVPLEEMVKIDYLYGANWSPWLDAKILLRTAGYTFSRSGL